MENYMVVLFKNKKKKKIIKKFITFSRAKQFYDKLIKESNEVLFEVKVEGGTECRYEVGIVEMSSKQLIPVYMTDEYGRNIKEQKKIKTQTFIKKYLKGDGLKMISVLNNKIVLQEDEKIHLFTLKSESESSRFVDSISSYFFKIKRGDCLFVKDYSTAQRKSLYALLESAGIDKKILYRKFTTLPQSK
jgi:hypothetical protein